MLKSHIPRSRTACNGNGIVAGILYQWIYNVTCIALYGPKTGILFCCLDKNIMKTRHTVYVSHYIRYLHNHCLPWKNIKYYMFWICVSVASVIRNSKEMCHIMLSVACLALPYFSTCLINCTILGEKLLNIKCVLWFSLQLLHKTFLILRSTEQDMIINVYWSSCKITILTL
jgi:hypothetical protein